MPDNNAYYLSSSLLKTKAGYSLYDAEEKIADIVHENGHLWIKIFTDKKVIINADIKTSHCWVEAAGSVEFHGQINLTDDLHLVARECHILGNCRVSGKSLIVADQLMVGDGKTGTRVKLLDESYVHAVRCKLHTNARLQFNSQNTKQPCHFGIDGALMLDEDATLYLNNSTVSVKSLFNCGNIALYNCEVEMSSVLQQGFLLADNATFTLYKQFTQNKAGYTELTCSVLSAQKIEVMNGHFTLDDTEYRGIECVFVAGNLSVVNESSITIAETLFILDEVEAQFNDCQVKVGQQLMLTGNVRIQQSKFNAGSVSQNNNIIHIQDSTLHAISSVEFSGGLQLERSYLYAHSLRFAGHLDMDELSADSKIMKFSSEHARVINSRIGSRLLLIEGAKIANEFVIDKSELCAHIIGLRKHIALNYSTLVDFGDEKISHAIEGDVVLKQSRFIAAGQVHACQEGSLELTGYSQVYASRIWNESDINISDSTIHATHLFQDNAVLTADASTIIVEDMCFVHANTLALKAQSKLLAGTGYITGRVSVSEQGVLATQQRMVFAADSATHCDDATIQAKKLVLAGATALRKSVLRADAIFSQGRLFASEQSHVLVTQQISLAPTAKVVVQESALVAPTIDNFGALVARNAQIVAQDKLNAWDGSITVLEGETSVDCTDMLLRATLMTRNKKSEVIKSGKKHAVTLSPKIKARGMFDIRRDAYTFGDGLTVDAQTIDHSGTTALKELRMTGKTLDNTGYLSAEKQLFLGFDQAVVNVGGTLDSNNITVHGNFFNIFGGVYARQRFESAGLVHFNLGLLAANRASISSIVSLNAGLVIPNFSGNFSDVASWSNVLNVARTLAVTNAPNYANVINLVGMLPSIWYTGRGFIQTYQQHNWKDFKNMRAHQWMPILCQAKDAAFLGKNIYRIGSDMRKVVDNENGQSSSEWDRVKQASKSAKQAAKQVYQAARSRETYTQDNLRKFLPQINRKSAASFSGQIVESSAQQAWQTLSGSYHNDSLLHANAGGSLVFHTHKTSLFHFNSGCERSFDSHTINTYGFHNAGMSFGRQTSITANRVTNAGYLAGTHRFHLKANELHNCDHSTVYGKGVDLELDKLEQSGTIDFTGGRARIGIFAATEPSEIYFTDMAVAGMSEQSRLNLNGRVTTNNVIFDYRDITDSSNLTCSGPTQFTAAHYDHSGYVAQEKQAIDPSETSDDMSIPSVFVVKADTAELQGSGDFTHAEYDIKAFADGECFVTGEGPYQDYRVSETLGFSVDSDFLLRRQMQRDCGLDIKARTILFDVNHTKNQILSLTSTVGDITITGDIQSRDIIANSAADIYTNSRIKATNTLSFSATNHFFNIGGHLSADKVGMTARHIENIARGSKAAQGQLPVAMGSNGIIDANSFLALEATETDIVNHGGVIGGCDYAQLVAKGNVYNLCQEHKTSGRHDVVTTFIPGRIFGGDGKSSKKLGLFIQAGGMVVSNVSDFLAVGDTYIEGEKVIFNGRQERAVVQDQQHESALGFSSEKIRATETSFYGSRVHSVNGCNMVRATNREVVATASTFSGEKGTDIYSLHDMRLLNLTGKDTVCQSNQSFWGLGGKHTHRSQERIASTVFNDDGKTRVHSELGEVDARGAKFIGAGGLEIEAKGRIRLSAAVLQHHEITQEHSTGISFFGINAWRTHQAGGGLTDCFAAEDATVAKMIQLSRSQDMLDLTTRSAALGIDLYNRAQTMMRGIANDNLGEELLAQYGLGGATGFKPRAVLSFDTTETRHSWQTLGGGGIQRGGKVTLKSSEGVDLENGVQVTSKSDVEIDAPELVAHAAALNSHYQRESQGVRLGISATGEVTHVGGSYEHTQTDRVQHVNARLAAAGTVKLHHNGDAMSQVELDGANIEANSLEGTVDKLSIRDRQDTATTETVSFALDTTGQVSGYYGAGYERTTTAQNSGIHTRAGLNTADHPFQVGELDMEGGQITTEGENHFNPQRMTARALTDERAYVGAGVSVNVNDLARLAGQTPTNTVGERAIATASVSADIVARQVQHDPVIYGAQGTHVTIEDLKGDVHTVSADGAHTIGDCDLHVNVEVPITNEQYTQQAQQDMHRGASVLVSKLSSPVASTAPLAQMQACVSAVAAAKKELQEQGSLSVETERSLKERFVEATLIAVKAIGEEGFDRFIEILGPEFKASFLQMVRRGGSAEDIYIRMRMGVPGILFSLGMNVMLSDEAFGSRACIEDATISTVVDVATVEGLVYMLGASAADPILIGLTMAEIVDAIVYDEVAVGRGYQQSLQAVVDAQAQTHGESATYEEHRRQHDVLRHAVDSQISYLIIQGTHTVIKLPSHVVQGLRWIYDNLDKPVSPPSSANVSTPLQRHGLFQPTIGRRISPRGNFKDSAPKFALAQ